MTTITVVELIFVILGGLLFALAAFGVTHARWNLVAAGLLAITIGVWFIPLVAK
jgi:hypothetical protein